MDNQTQERIYHKERANYFYTPAADCCEGILVIGFNAWIIVTTKINHMLISFIAEKCKERKKGGGVVYAHRNINLIVHAFHYK